MYQPSYRRKLEAIKINRDRVANSGNLLDYNGDLADDPFVIEEEATEEITKVDAAADSWKDRQLKRQNQTATLLEVDEGEEDDEVETPHQEIANIDASRQIVDEIAKVDTAADSWKDRQLKRQNQTATLLEVDEDEENKAEATKINSPQAELDRQQRLDNLLNTASSNLKKTEAIPQDKNNQRQSPQFKYQGISINNLRQLKYVRYLLTPQVIQRYSNSNLSIKLKGILVLEQNKKVGLILADISQNNRVAEVVSLVTPDSFALQV